jgi:molybdate transport system substrate-binding protein
MRSRWRAVRRAAFVAVLLLHGGIAGADELRVMTSGTFTAAFLELAPRFERATGVGTESIPSRLQRREPADVVIVDDVALDQLIKDGLVVAGSRVPLARSGIAMAVRAGAPRPDISSPEALRRTLLAAASVAYSSSVSGRYVTTELYQRLGIADQMAGKSRRIERERVGAVVARGEAEIGFQQMSELLPVPGIDLVGPLPGDLQRTSVFSAGVVAASPHVAAARELIRFLASPEAADAVTKTGLELAPR